MQQSVAEWTVEKPGEVPVNQYSVGPVDLQAGLSFDYLHFDAVLQKDLAYCTYTAQHKYDCMWILRYKWGGDENTTLGASTDKYKRINTCTWPKQQK